MRFVIVLALLYCCYAAEQATLAPQQEGRLPPQHIKNFVEQHIKHVKQQIPLLKQQIKEGKLKVDIQQPTVNDQKVPENIKQFIKAHIIQVLQHVSEQKEKKRMESSHASGVILKEDVKDATEKAKPHIPQVINQEVAHKNQSKGKQDNTSNSSQNNTGKEEENIAKAHNQHVAEFEKQEVVKERAVSDHNQATIHQHVPHIINHHTHQIDKKVSQEKNVVTGQGTNHVQIQNNKIQETPIDRVQGIVQQIHQHIPPTIKQNQQSLQVVSQNGVQKENDTQIQKREVEGKAVVTDNGQGIKEQVQQHVPQVINPQHVDHVNKVISQEQPIVEQVQQHVPQAVTEHVNQVTNKIDQEKPVIPGHILGIVEQIHHHIPQVISQHNSLVQNKDAQTPLKVPERVQQAHQHILQIIKEKQAETQHVAHDKSKDAQVAPEKTAQIQDIFQQVHQHVPQTIKEQQAETQKKNDQETPVVCSNAQGNILDIGQSVKKDQKKSVQEDPVNQLNTENNVQQNHQNVPQTEKPTEDHVAQVISNISLPEQTPSHATNTHVNKKHNIHPLAEKVVKSTRLEQITNNHNISPVRTN